MVTKEDILGTLDDLLTKFLYYDRKEDEDLGVGEIENAIKDDIITIDEMIELFKLRMEESVND